MRLQSGDFHIGGNPGAPSGSGRGNDLDVKRPFQIGPRSGYEGLDPNESPIWIMGFIWFMVFCLDQVDTAIKGPPIRF